MPSHIVLIDYENIRPADLHLLSGHDCMVKVFLGPNQKNVPRETWKALQPLGSAVEPIELQVAGKNALDFHIAFYLGQLSLQHPEARFWIISRDSGFDPLIRHLQEKKIACKRVVGAAEIFTVSTTRVEHPKDRFQKVVSHLEKLKAKPRKIKTLRASIRNLFKETIDEVGIDALVASLKEKNILSEADGKVTSDLLT